MNQNFNQIFIDFLEKTCELKIKNINNNYVEIVGDFANPYSIELNKKFELEENIPKFLIENNNNMICCYKYKLEDFENNAVNQPKKIIHPYWDLPISLENNIDFENFLKKGYVITRNIIKTNVKYEQFNPLPIFIEDLHKIKINNNKLFNTLYLYNKTFKTVIFSGIVIKIRIKHFNIDDPTLHATYQVDDGTSSIIMNFKHKTKEKLDDLEKIEKLDDITSSLLKNSDSKNSLDKIKMIKSMNIIINTINTRIKSVNNTIKSGEKVLIIGAPYKNKYNNKINIRGLHYEYLSNNNYRDTKEIFWKNYVINLYKNYYYNYTVDGQKL